MLVDIFGKVQYVSEFTSTITVEGERLYVFLKQNDNGDTIMYEYLGSLFSTLEDKDTAFMRTFHHIATHYTMPAGSLTDLRKLKDQLDSHDRGLKFEGQQSL